ERYMGSLQVGENGSSACSARRRLLCRSKTKRWSSCTSHIIGPPLQWSIWSGCAGRDAQSAAELERLERELEQTDINPFRRMMVEIGRRITAFKAEMLAELEARLMANQKPEGLARSAAKSRRGSPAEENGRQARG